MSRHKRTMHRVMRNLHGLKLRRYVVLIININEYLDVLPGAKASDKICEMEVNEVLFNSMVNFWISQACVQGFDCEYIGFKKRLRCLNAWK